MKPLPIEEHYHVGLVLANAAGRTPLTSVETEPTTHTLKPEDFYRAANRSAEARQALSRNSPRGANRPFSE